jgi:hypothetical protein
MSQYMNPYYSTTPTIGWDKPSATKAIPPQSATSWAHGGPTVETAGQRFRRLRAARLAREAAQRRRAAAAAAAAATRRRHLAYLARKKKNQPRPAPPWQRLIDGGWYPAPRPAPLPSAYDSSVPAPYSLKHSDLSPIAAAIHAKLVERIYGGQSHHDVVEAAAEMAPMVTSKTSSLARMALTELLTGGRNTGRELWVQSEIGAPIPLYIDTVIEAASEAGALTDSLDQMNLVIDGAAIVEPGATDDAMLGTVSLEPKDEMMLGDVGPIMPEFVDEMIEFEVGGEPFYKNPMVLAGAAVVALGGFLAMRSK